MAIEIKNYDGTTLAVVQDGTANTTSSSIPFVGRGYKSWGTPIQQNILWLLQNFAGASEPSNPITGQIWYDTENAVLKMYNGSSWTTSQGIILQSTAPDAGNNVGSMWFDTTNMQLYIWIGSQWKLIGPLASSAGLDPVEPAVPAMSSIDSIRVIDNLGTSHNIWRLVVGGTLLATFSRDVAFIPRSSTLLSNGFPRIYPGITFNNTLNDIDVGIFGDDTIFRSTQTNLPSVDNTHSLGSQLLRFLNIFAANATFGNLILGSSGTVVSESANGTIKLTDSSGTNFNMIQLGGTTTAYPAIKRSNAAINFRLANDSANANIIAGNVTASNTIFAVNANISGTLDTVTLTGTTIGTNTLILSNTGTGSRISQSSDGVILVTNNAQNNFSFLQLGGTTASFPAIKRNGAGIDFIVANDSAAANISAAAGTFTSATVTGAITVGSAGSKITNSSDGVLLLSNNAVSGFTRLQLGGTNSNFPSIKRNGAALNFRLADDTADAAIISAGITASGAISGTSISTTGAVTSSSASGGVGYATGAGDTLTQGTSVTTTVVSAGKMTGQITLFSGARASQTNVNFTFTNPSIASTDHVIVTHINGGTLGAYNITATPAAGSATISLRNVTAGSLTEAPVLKYTIIKSVNA